jgi:hypothetical protein
MKKAFLVTLALVMALTMVMGSVTTASASPPTANWKIQISVTKVVGQTIYYKYNWSVPSSWNVKNCQVSFSYMSYSPDIYDQLVGSPTVTSFNEVTSKYRSTGEFTVNPANEYEHSLVSGDKIKVELHLCTENGSEMGFCTYYYTVP